MCGIFGVSFNPKSGGEGWTPSEMAQIMFPEIIHRGPHAFGWMWYREGGQVHMFKREGPCNTDESLERMSHIPDDVKWLVCHVRFATHGKPSELVNNHPILHKNIIGVHNGVLRNHEYILRQTGRQFPEALVDSEAIFAAVNKWGHEKGLARIQGDMVAVYSDLRKPNTLNIARSYGRPLVFANTKAGNLVFASEQGVIEALGIEHKGYKHFLSTNMLLKVRSGKIRERREYMPRPTYTPVPKAPEKRIFTSPHKKQWQKNLEEAVERDKQRKLQKPPKHFAPRTGPRGDALSDPLTPEEFELLERYEKEFEERYRQLEGDSLD